MSSIKSNSKQISIGSVVFMALAALLGVRWFSTAGIYGAGSILLWIIAAVIFFIPMAFICAELSSIYPEGKGGMIDWIRLSIGEKPAYYASWLYYVSFYFYFPSVLTFSAIAIAYAFFPDLSNNKFYVISFVLIAYWVITLIVLKGYKTASKFSSYGGLLGVTIPIIVIVVLALISVFILKKPIASNYSLGSFIPHLDRANLMFIPTLALAMAGVEILSPFACRMKNPSKSFPKAVILSAICVTAGYIIGTAALTFVLPSSQIGAASGILSDITKVTSEMGFAIGGQVVCVMIAYASLAACCIIIYGITTFLIDGNGKDYLPDFIKKKNKDDMPGNLILIQAVIITIIVILTSTFSSVENIYTILIMVEVILMFIPYLILIAGYIKTKKSVVSKKATFRVPGKKPGFIIASVLVIIMSVISIGTPFISLPAGESIIRYEISIIIGVAAMVIFGWALSKYALKKAADKNLK